jgi:hypothetical protein
MLPAHIWQTQEHDGLETEVSICGYGKYWNQQEVWLFWKNTFAERGRIQNIFLRLLTYSYLQ